MTSFQNILIQILSALEILNLITVAEKKKGILHCESSLPLYEHAGNDALSNNFHTKYS